MAVSPTRNRFAQFATRFFDSRPARKLFDRMQDQLREHKATQSHRRESRFNSCCPRPTNITVNACRVWRLVHGEEGGTTWDSPRTRSIVPTTNINSRGDRLQ